MGEGIILDKKMPPLEDGDMVTLFVKDGLLANDRWHLVVESPEQNGSVVSVVDQDTVTANFPDSNVGLGLLVNGHFALGIWGNDGFLRGFGEGEITGVRVQRGSDEVFSFDVSP